MNTVLDFLAFRTLISGPVLILFYYLGAVGIPVGAWLLAMYLMQRFEIARNAYEQGRRTFVAALPKRRRVTALLLFVTAFVFMELLWRLMFEYLIAFMQIRDALVSSGV
jgi:hypothetical protein